MTHYSRKHRSILLASFMLFCLMVGSVQSAPMNVTATVLGVCQLGTISDMAFGGLTPGSGLDVSATATIEWRCTNGTSADITLNDGGNGNRSMSGPGLDTLSFELYKDAALSERWGDAGAETVTLSGVGMVGFSSATVYGEVLHADYVGTLEGVYIDIVTVNIVIN